VTVDPYLDAASGVLRNRLGITDPERLGRVEAGLSAAALADLGVRSLPGGYGIGVATARGRREGAERARPTPERVRVLSGGPDVAESEPRLRSSGADSGHAGGR
jgi:hypothetical protein